MNILLTGMGGTVAPAVARSFEAAGSRCTGWDRGSFSQEDRTQAAGYLDSLQPQLLIHCGMASPDGAGMLAQLAAERGMGFVFTSTVSVYSEAGTGPYSPSGLPNAEEPYGLYKRQCEERVLAANPGSWIIRLGWQIGTEPGSNNMVDYLYREMSQKGFIEASRRWLPSCSFLDQTAEALRFMVERLPAGLYLANANRGLSFYDIASRLALDHSKLQVRPTDSFVRDDRMVDERLPLRDLDEILSQPPRAGT